MDIYFRQYWTDYRLRFDHMLEDILQNKTNEGNPIKALALEANFLEKMWKPDLFFSLVKKGESGKLTKPNKLVRLNSNGEIFYSQR